MSASARRADSGSDAALTAASDASIASTSPRISSSTTLDWSFRRVSRASRWSGVASARDSTDRPFAGLRERRRVVGMDLGRERHEPARDVLEPEQRRPLEVVAVEQPLVSSLGTVEGHGLVGADALGTDREPAGDDTADDHADEAEDGRHDRDDDRHPRVGHAASSHAPGPPRSPFRSRRTARSERDTVPRGPVAQRQSTGLLIPWSWVRIPPGSPRLMPCRRSVCWRPWSSDDSTRWATSSTSPSRSWSSGRPSTT